MTPDTGWVIPTANTNALLSALLAAAQLDQSVLHEMGLHARKLVESQFDIRVLAQSHLELFNELINGSAKVP